MGPGSSYHVRWATKMEVYSSLPLLGWNTSAHLHKVVNFILGRCKVC